MDPWVWIAAYLVGFALLQVVLYRYFRRDVPQGETATPRSPESGAPPAPTTGTPEESSERTCPHCGTVNERDQSITFCRECVCPLQ